MGEGGPLAVDEESKYAMNIFLRVYPPYVVVGTGVFDCPPIHHEYFLSCVYAKYRGRGRRLRRPVLSHNQYFFRVFALHIACRDSASNVAEGNLPSSLRERCRQPRKITASHLTQRVAKNIIIHCRDRRPTLPKATCQVRSANVVDSPVK